MPEATEVADMLRADVADTRRAWINAARRDPKEHTRRQQSDFLANISHKGEVPDFHSLRHTCGAWLAMNGAHPKAVQSVMRHSTITLTMDTYGHLFPGQDAATVARFPSMMASEPVALRATGTEGAGQGPTPERINGSGRHGGRENAAHAQQSGRDLVPDDATQCDEEHPPPRNGTSPNSLRVAGLCEDVRRGASECDSTPGRIRTCNQRIRNPLLYPLSYGRFIGLF
jgi:Phage integrase family